MGHGDFPLESLERAVAEIEALQAIYSHECTVRSLEELEQALQVIASSGGNTTMIPKLEVEIAASDKVALHCTLPPGYPGSRPAQVYVSAEHWQRSVQDEVSGRLRKFAEARVGDEVVMDLVQELQQVMAAQHIPDSSADEDVPSLKSDKKNQPTVRRCWIWAHHINDADRRKSIVREAREMGLGGYLKPGYPGIVVIEGEACESFVNWIKGSKSRAGGFGRNWGHHVRGELAIPSSERQLPLEFNEIDESMKELGMLCTEHGLDKEFREYVLQHSYN